MGKLDEEQSLSSSVISSEFSSSEENVENGCFRISGFIRFRCVMALILGAAVLLSAIFWLPPFWQYRDRADLNLDSNFRGLDVVASFKIHKPLFLVKANIMQLEHDIFDEIGVINSSVVVISLETMGGPNTTRVVFGVVPSVKYSNISSAGMSILRASFVSLVIQQSSFNFSSLFGNPFSFEVLKFQGGITVIPQQSAFLLQKVQILFNFTINFSIHQIQENFNELRNQLISGLHLSIYENLYISLTNLQGSTVAPSTTVQASVLRVIGNLPPSRLKQLTQTITGSPARNLGLNHTVFGRVKQVHLSILQHSLNGGGSSGTSWSPSPAPMHHFHHQHHQHHLFHDLHHHHHHHHQDVSLAPTLAPEISHEAKPPSGWQFGFTRKPKRCSHLAPTVAPMVSPYQSAAPPHLHVDPPSPDSHAHPASSPLQAVDFAHIWPPSESIRHARHADPPNVTPSVSPLPSSSSAGLLPHAQWSLPLLLPLIIRLL